MLLIREDSIFKELECLAHLVLKAKGCSAVGSSSERPRKPPETQTPEVQRVSNQGKLNQSGTFTITNFFLLPSI